ncbi:MAG TPA: hypothetical protein VKB93_08865 [Thermoanaerobaculia bacterium]|nr:hypothetical protein [Thermoanaerobaculia bacterium]
MKYFLAFLALAVALTWPLALHLDTAVADRGDPLLTAWILDWVCYSLTHAPLGLYDAPIYYPAHFPLAYSENLVGIAVVMLPLHLAGLSPLTIQNIAILLGFAFSAYGMFVLARLITRDVLASLLAGIVFAFGSFMLAHVQHIQILWSGWLPLMFAALFVYRRSPTTKHAALLGGAFVMNGLTNIYWLVFGSFMLVLTIAFLGVKSRLRLFAAPAIASLVLVPFLVPYAIVAQEYGAARTTGESRGGSASVTDWLVPSSRNLLYGSLADPARHRDERELFPGLIAIFLALAALVERRALARRETRRAEARRSTGLFDVAIFASGVVTYLAFVNWPRIWDVPAMVTVILLIARFFPRFEKREEHAATLWIVVGFVASLGWNAFLHPFLFRVFTPFHATRTPARWAIIVLMGLALWAAIGAAKQRKPVLIVLLVLSVLEVLPRIRWDHLDPKTAPVYHWLAQAKPGPVLELPIIAHGVPYEYILANTVHRVPILNGGSGWEPPHHKFLREKEDKLEYDDAFLAKAIESGAAIVIVHEQRLTAERKAALAPMLQKLVPLRRFGSDAVFSTPRGLAGTASAPRESPRQ